MPAISSASVANMAVHAWTKPYTETVCYILGVYAAFNVWLLPEVTSTTHP